MEWMFLAIVISMVLLGSVVFAAPSSTLTITLVVVLGILLLGENLNLVAVHQAEPVRSLLYVVYFSIPQFSWFYLGDFVVHKIGSVEWLYNFLASLYSMAYSAFFLLATWVCFRRKGLNK